MATVWLREVTEKLTLSSVLQGSSLKQRQAVMRDTECWSGFWGPGVSAVHRWAGVCSVCTQACPSTASRTLQSLAFLSLAVGENRVSECVSIWVPPLLCVYELTATDTWSLTCWLRTRILSLKQSTGGSIDGNVLLRTPKSYWCVWVCVGVSFKVAQMLVLAHFVCAVKKSQVFFFQFFFKPIKYCLKLTMRESAECLTLCSTVLRPLIGVTQLPLFSTHVNSVWSRNVPKSRNCPQVNV